MGIYTSQGGRYRKFLGTQYWFWEVKLFGLIRHSRKFCGRTEKSLMYNYAYFLFSLRLDKPRIGGTSANLTTRGHRLRRCIAMSIGASLTKTHPKFLPWLVHNLIYTSAICSQGGYFKACCGKRVETKQQAASYLFFSQNTRGKMSES